MALDPHDKWDSLRQGWRSSASIFCTENAYTCLVCQKAVDLQLLVEQNFRSRPDIPQAFYSRVRYTSKLSAIQDLEIVSILSFLSAGTVQPSQRLLLSVS